MAVSIPDKLLKTHVAQGNLKPAKKRTSVYDEIKKVSLENSSLMARNDKIFFDENTQSLTIILNGALTVSHNKILRAKYQALDGYNKSWYERIWRLVERNSSLINLWKSSIPEGERLILESIEASSRTAKDNDSSSGSFKPVVDGLVNAKLIVDDSPEFLFILPPLPVKEKVSRIILRLKPSPSLANFYSEDFFRLACT